MRDRTAQTSRTIYSVRESYRRAPAGFPGPIVLLNWSGDSDWLFFAIDPMGSQSIAADGLRVRALSARDGRTRALATMLAYPDYFTWCAGRLVFIAGGNRLATINKHLLSASPPDWRAKPLVRLPRRAWGSVVCSADGKSVVVQSQPESNDYDFFHTKWSLWQVGFDGSARQLTTPPRGYADESPRYTDGGRTLMFVRSRRGHGRLFELKSGRIVGPLRSLGYSLGYYGHHDWWSKSR